MSYTSRLGPRLLDLLTQVPAGAAMNYDDKPAEYFDGARHDIVALLPDRSDTAVLELGCGAGATGSAALTARKAKRYVGIELNASAAAIAAERLSEVLVADVETMPLGDLSGGFEVLVISEVLEHLKDPWSVLERLAGCLKPGGLVFASSPNVAHWAIVRELLFGRFDYQESGVMDRTHLRWFTPQTYRELFNQAGFEVDELRSLSRPGWKGRLLVRLSGGRLGHLLTTQIMVIGHRL